MGQHGAMYDSRWRATRRGWLAKHPFCSLCAERGVVSAANVLDHIHPHGGDWAVFWDRDNWQSLCTQCHSGAKQRGEKAKDGVIPGVGVDGLPLDPNHRWNKA